MAPGHHNLAGIVELKKNKLYRLVGDFRYEWTIDGVAQRITIPAGFEFDGASIPSWATTLTRVLPFIDTIEPYGRHIYAALVHDFIWMYRGRLPEGAHQMQLSQGTWVDAAYDVDGRPVWTFETSNRLFARMLREDGVGKTERRAMYLAVQYTPIAWWSWRTGKLPDDARPERVLSPSP